MAGDVYSKLGVEPVINCATTYTRLGGSMMSPHVTNAMTVAAGSFVDVEELQAAVGKRIAELTHNDGAYVTNGAAAGIALAAAACMTGKDPAAMAKLPHDVNGLKHEFIVQRNQRNYYDIAIRQVGGRIVEIGHAMETAAWELDAAWSERTAGVFYFAGAHLNRQTLPLPLVVEWAHSRNLPVIVDAAAQIPPVSNLWHFTRELKADIAIFSGGKGLGGPQSSGLIVGQADLIQAITLNGPPNHRIGRPMKVAKESMIGLLATIEHYLDPAFEADRTAQASSWMPQLERWHEVWSAVAGEGITLTIDPHGEAGEPVPRIIVRFGAGAALDLGGFLAALRAEHPRIEVVANDATSAAISAHLLKPGEADIVERRVKSVLQG